MTIPPEQDAARDAVDAPAERTPDLVHVAPQPAGPDVIEMTPQADQGDEPAPRRSHTRRILIGSLLAAAVASGALFGTTGWRVLQQKDARLEPPEQVAGLVRDDSANAIETAEYLRTALAAGVELDDTVGAVYSDPAQPQRGVLFIGGTALLFSPGRELEAVFGMLGDELGAVTSVRDQDAGDLGGVLRCGATKTAEGEMTVCGWADHGSIAVGMFPERSIDESGALLRDMRGAMQTRQ